MVKRDLDKRPSVRKMLLTPFMVGMSLLLILIGIGLYSQYVKYYEKLTTSRHTYASYFYMHAMRDYQATMGGILETLAADKSIAELLLAKDPFLLQERFANLFSQLGQSCGLISLQFVDAERHVLMRMHRPQDYGDLVQRTSFAEAESTEGIVSGLGIGSTGRLTLRLVTPVYMPDVTDAGEGVLSGFIECAMDVNDIMISAEQPKDMFLAFVLDKERLTRGDQNKKVWCTQDTRSLWVNVSDTMVAYTSRTGLTPEFARELLHNREAQEADDPGERFTLVRDGSYYLASAVPLTDSLGNPLGDLFIIEDATRLWNEYLLMALLMLGTGLGIIGASRIVLTEKLGKIDAGFSELVDKLSEAELIFESVFTQSATGFVLLNWQTGEVVMANKAAMKIFNVQDAATISLSELKPLPLEDPFLKEWQASEELSSLMCIHHEGNPVYCAITHFYIGTNVELQCAAIRDVTELLGLQREHARYIQYLQIILDRLPGYLCIKDSNKRLKNYNMAFCKFFGQHAKINEIMDYPHMDDDSLKAMLEADDKALLTDEPVIYEARQKGANGKIYTHKVAKQRIKGPQGNYYILTAGTDITERIKMENQLVKLRHKAEAANLAKSQFLARMSHEIRTPMNVILGMSHLAQGAALDEKSRNYLDKIQGAAKNLLSIINDILDFSKIEAGEMEIQKIPFSLSDMLDEIKTTMQAQLIGKHVEFKLEAPEIQGMLLGDPLRIRQVILNLTSNAIKFTHQGYVKLECEPVSMIGDVCKLKFIVEDTGIGIADDCLGSLFTKFHQLDGGITRQYGGTGMGLSLSQEFIRLMGSYITVESTVGKGSRFTFTISLERASEEFNESALPNVAAALELFEARHVVRVVDTDNSSFQPDARVLVVDDNEINREIITELLTGLELNVVAVSNGQEAVDAVEESPFDLVLMDLHMPVMDGLEATKTIRSSMDSMVSRLPVIALTANNSDEDRSNCLEVGMDDFIAKPIDVDELKEKLGHWLKHKVA